MLLKRIAIYQIPTVDESAGTMRTLIEQTVVIKTSKSRLSVSASGCELACECISVTKQFRMSATDHDLMYLSSTTALSLLDPCTPRAIIIIINRHPRDRGEHTQNGGLRQISQLSCKSVFNISLGPCWLSCNGLFKCSIIIFFQMFRQEVNEFTMTSNKLRS